MIPHFPLFLGLQFCFSVALDLALELSKVDIYKKKASVLFDINRLLEMKKCVSEFILGDILLPTGYEWNNSKRA